jgi:hypothetical protein
VLYFLGILGGLSSFSPYHCTLCPLGCLPWATLIFYSRYRDFWALVLIVLYPSQFFWLRQVAMPKVPGLPASRTCELSQRRGRADRNPHSLVLITCYPYISFVYSCNGCFESCCEVWNIVELINLPSGVLTVSFIPGFDSNTCIVSSTEIYRPSRNYLRPTSPARKGGQHSIRHIQPTPAH